MNPKRSVFRCGGCPLVVPVKPRESGSIPQQRMVCKWFDSIAAATSKRIPIESPLSIVKYNRPGIKKGLNNDGQPFNLNAVGGSQLKYAACITLISGIATNSITAISCILSPKFNIFKVFRAFSRYLSATFRVYQSQGFVLSSARVKHLLARVNAGRLINRRIGRSHQVQRNHCDDSSERCIGSQVELAFFGLFPWVNLCLN